MALIQYVKQATVRSDEKVSIWFKGQIGLNHTLVVNRKLEQYHRAIMFFDPELKQVVIQLTADPKIDGAVNISYGKNHVGMISAVPYLRQFGIDHTKSKVYPAHYNEKDNTIILNIAEGIAVTVKALRKPKAAKTAEPVLATTEPATVTTESAK